MRRYREIVGFRNLDNVEVTFGKVLHSTGRHRHALQQFEQIERLAEWWYTPPDLTRNIGVLQNRQVFVGSGDISPPAKQIHSVALLRDAAGHLPHKAFDTTVFGGRRQIIKGNFELSLHSIYCVK